jgi:hypothetical protein
MLNVENYPVFWKTLRLPSSGWNCNGQPTLKVNKGRVKCKTPSLARLDSSCIRNALLDMVKGALN